MQFRPGTGEEDLPLKTTASWSTHVTKERRFPLELPVRKPAVCDSEMNRSCFWSLKALHTLDLARISFTWRRSNPH